MPRTGCERVSTLSEIDGTWNPRFGEDLATLLLVNPNCLHVYWDVSDATRMQVEMHNHCEWGCVPKQLRLYDVTDIWFNGWNAPVYQVIPVQDVADNWYIHNLPPGRDWVIDLGIQTRSDSWVSLCRSNVVQAPARQEEGCQPTCKFMPSTVISPEWETEFTGYSMHSDVQAAWGISD